MVTSIQSWVHTAQICALRGEALLPSLQAMTVYVDTARHPFKGYIMCHMIADSLDELHSMADQIGMERRWFQAPPKASHPHYDIPEHKRAKALALGAQEVCQRTGLHYAARLGLEWAEAECDHARKDKYRRTLIRTQAYADTLKESEI